MRSEKTLSCYTDLHETRTDTRISLRARAREKRLALTWLQDLQAGISNLCSCAEHADVSCRIFDCEKAAVVP